LNRTLLRAALAAFVVSLFPAARAAGPLLRRPDIFGDRIVFSAEGDLWLGSVSGGTARRITTAAGVETEPRFSPDGSQIAFSGQYDGGRDVYVVPAAGGSPVRLTWDPNGVRIIGWTPDGKNVLFSSARVNPEKRRRLWSVSAKGGMPSLLPIPWVAHAAMAPDGKRVAYVPISAEWQHWKDYTAGQADDIWITDITQKSFRRLTTSPSIDTTPTWAGDVIYFISERDGLANLYRLDPQSGAVAPATHYTDLECRYPESDGKRVIFQHGDGLALYDPATGASRVLDVRLGTDQIHARPRRVPALDNLNFAALGPTGKRLFVEARGQIVSVPVEQGDWRVLASESGTRSQYPAWSPDGKQIAFDSDRSGEEQIWIAPSSGPGAARQLTRKHTGPLGRIVWSPDGKYIATSDREMRILLVDVKTGETTLVDQADRGGSYDTRNESYTFSPDGKWLAFHRMETNWANAVYLYNISTKSKTAITSDTINSYNPAFDPDGKYLYFLQDRSFDPIGPGPSHFFSYDKVTNISAVTLARDTKSPFLPKSDEEGAAPDKAEAKPDADKKPDAKADKADAKPEEKKLPEVKVDLDGIADRVEDVPLPTDRYQSVDPVKDRLLLLVNNGPGEPGSTMRAFNMKDVTKKEVKTISSKVDGYELSADRTKVLVRNGKTFYVIDASADSLKDEDKVDLGGIQLEIDPRAEWQQMFEESWRIARDFFYDPNMHGVDWPAVKTKYAARVQGIGDRSELNEILGDMIAELRVGHAYVGGGDAPGGAKPVPMGYLGADFAPVPGKAAYKIVRLLPGDGFDLDARSPLLAPGLNVHEGDYVLAIAGQPVQENEDIQALLVGTAGRAIRVTVNTAPTMEGAREVLVQPMASESQARYYQWVAGRREYVRVHGGDDLGYVHIPDMGNGGLVEYTKHYFPLVQQKDGMIYDVRYNGGGYISAMLLMQMASRPINYYKPRYGASWPREDWAFRGYSAAVCNDQNYSDAEYFVDGFKKLKIGPVFGAQTGGGEVGSGGGYPLIDGGKIWIPNYGGWSPDGNWIVEGVGANPDVLVQQDPAAVLAGRDPQLDAAIAYLKDKLAKAPIPKLVPPPFPVVRSGTRAAK
jgi:tricorn protease